MIQRTRLVLLVLFVSLCGAGLEGSPAGVWLQPADTLIVHGNVYTVNPAQPFAEAIAIRGSDIVAVGSSQELAAYRGARTRVIDARGNWILPGFTDCHIHFLEGSLSLLNVNLEGAASIAELQDRLRQFASAHPERPWILGRGWVYSTFGSEALPHKKYLDAVAADRPVFLEAYDGHTYWANSKALERAGITRSTPDPANGVIVRDATTGEPTGALKEAAAHLVERVVPKPSREEKLQALRMGIAEAHRAGLVRVHSCGGDYEALDLYSELTRLNQLTLRMYIAFFLDPPELTSAMLGRIDRARQQYRSEWLEVRAVKIMLDGVVESHTASMLDPYADDPKQHGKLFWDPENYKRAVKELDRDGWQIFTHSIGDGAVRLALDADEEAAQANKTRDRRHRIEHIETITAADVPRFGRSGVIASFQPLHAYPDANTLNVWARNAGPDRVSRAFGWQGIAKTGGRLAFGSDWPVVTLNPWDGIQNAVTRTNASGNPPGGWVPHERVSLAQAIEAYTLGAAFAGRHEKREGSIEPGKLADLILVTPNLFKADPHTLSKTEVLVTVVGGKMVYEAPGWTDTAPVEKR